MSGENKMSDVDVICLSSSEDEIEVTVPPKRKKDDNNNDYEIQRMPGDGHCLVHCFAVMFHETKELVLQRVWNEISNNADIYKSFGEYSSCDELMNEVAKYAFEKGYGHDTADFIIEALSNVYKCRVFVHRNNPQKDPEGIVGEKFQNKIHVLKTKEHYDLLLAVDGISNPVKTEEEFILAERYVTLIYFLYIFYKIEIMLID